MVLGLSATLPRSLAAGLQSHGVAAGTAAHVAHLPPVSVLFAAFLGYNPVQHLIGASSLAQLPPSAAAQLTSPSYFPSLIAPAFRSGLHEAFGFAVACCLIAAAASWSRGGRYVHDELVTLEPAPAERKTEADMAAAPFAG
jgi:hypothetical protein